MELLFRLNSYIDMGKMPTKESHLWQYRLVSGIFWKNEIENNFDCRLAHQLNKDKKVHCLNFD